MIGKKIITDGCWVQTNTFPDKPRKHEFLKKGEEVVIVWTDKDPNCPFIVGLANNGKTYGSLFNIR